MSLSQPLNPLRTRDSAHRQQSTGNLSWKSAGSGFESLAAHKSPGQSADLGFFMPAGHLLFDLFSHAALPPTGPCGLQVIVTVRHITECLAPAFEQFLDHLPDLGWSIEPRPSSITQPLTPRSLSSATTARSDPH